MTILYHRLSGGFKSLAEVVERRVSRHIPITGGPLTRLQFLQFIFLSDYLLSLEVLLNMVAFLRLLLPPIGLHARLAPEKLLDFGVFPEHFYEVSPLNSQE